MVANQVWHMEKNSKVIVELNGHGQGNDNGSNLLVRFLGLLAQNPSLCPIHIVDWRWMPKDKRHELWKMIEGNFLFDYLAACKWVMEKLGDRWKANKQKLRCKYFYLYKTKKELFANPPPGVDSGEWSTFVHHYNEDKIKKICSQNAKNRKKLKVSHAGGSKSNARKACEMEKKLGRPACRGEVVISNLLKKDGSYANEETKIIADKISESLPQDQECAASSGVLSMILAHPNDVIRKVFGVEHSGRVRGLGHGVCPTNIFDMPTQCNIGASSNNVSQQRIEDLEKQVVTLQDKLSGYDETKAQLLQTQTQLSNIFNFLQDRFGSDLPFNNVSNS